MAELLYNRDGIELWHADARAFDYCDVDCIIADLPYGNTRLINDVIQRTMPHLRGRVGLYCMASTDVVSLDTKPARLLPWVKPTSTKNTSMQYADFIEMWALYRRDRTESMFVTPADAPGVHWSQRIGHFTDLPDASDWHMHQKPISQIIRFIRNHTLPEDVILDPTCGSGTTLVAAYQTNRRAIGIELNIVTATDALKRLEQARLGVGSAHRRFWT